MNTGVDTITACKIADNEVHLFYRIDDFAFSEGPKVCLGVLADDRDARGNAIGQVVHDDQIAPIQRRYHDNEVWEEVGPNASGPGKTARTGLSTDLHPAITDLLSGKRADLVRRWRLGPHARQSVQTADLYESGQRAAPGGRKALHLALKPIQQRRLAAAGVSTGSLVVAIDDVQLVGFASGVAYLVVVVQLSRTDGNDLEAVEVIEATHSLSRFNDCYWAAENPSSDHAEPADDRAASEPKPFSLGLLMRRLAQREIPERLVWNRANTYAMVRLRETCPTETADTLSSYLSRRYTTDYALDPDNARIARVTDFQNVRHAISGEGQATVICPRSDGHLPDFLSDWRTLSMRGAYSPLVLMHLHEYWFLTQNRAKALVSDASGTGLDRLEQIVEDALVFRICFRFGSVSDVSMHSAFAQSIRQALNLDRKLDELQGDVEAMSERISAAQESRLELENEEKFHKYYWVGVLGGATLVGLTVFTIFKEILDFPSVAPVIAKVEYSSVHWLAVGVAVFVAGLAVYMGHRRRPSRAPSRHKSNFTMGAALLNLVRGPR